MNERIKELAEQLELPMLDHIDYDTGDRIRMFTFHEHNLEKFAKLIVRECAELCHMMAEDSDSYVVHDGDTCARQIKKHFGVEE